MKRLSCQHVYGLQDTISSPPSRSVVGHIYVRRHKPKFWESVHRAFTPGIDNPLQMMVLNRIKYQLGYPEAAKDMLKPKSLLTAVEHIQWEQNDHSRST